MNPNFIGAGVSALAMGKMTNIKFEFLFKMLFCYLRLGIDNTEQN